MDFATELDAEDGLEVKAPSLANVLAWRGIWIVHIYRETESTQAIRSIG